jgi:radical SAM superfamily enzyme YgiQ (UPF0313 family)
MSTKGKYKLLLVRPLQKFKHYSTQKELAVLMGKKVANTPLSLPLIAALTPDNYQIRIADEEIASLPKNYKPDIVGITVITSNSERAFEIADEYRGKGAKVVFGGPYPSYSLEDCSQHADTVIIGEAEDIWEEVLSDFENNNLKPSYQAKIKPDYKKSVKPRWDLLPSKDILAINVQASRGCPFLCEFCLTSQMFGRKVRFRDVDNVIEEIKNLPLKNVFFCDDNLTINKKYARELFAKLKPLKISWMCQSSVDVADDPEFLKEMSEAGCKFILIGFESINEESLEETNKHQNNKEKYLEIIERIHSFGMHVYGSFIIGFDHDNHKTFQNFIDFIQEANLPVFMLSLLCTTKGTELHERLGREGRLFKNLSNNFDMGLFPLLKYENFSNEEIFIGLGETLKKLYSFEMLRKRTIPLLEKGYFSEEKSQGSISFKEKFRSTFVLFFSYRFSKNRHKRGMWKDVISLIKRKKLDIGEAASLLLMLESINRHLRKDEKLRNFYLDEIKKVQ